MRRSCVMVLAAVMLALAACDACANGASYASQGGNVYPMKNDRVRMAREIVEITEAPMTAGSEPLHFHCRFWFENPGDSTSVRMGFPIHVYSAQPHDFTARVDGRVVQAVPGDPVPENHAPDEALVKQLEHVFLWPVTFPARGGRVVDVDYDLDVEQSDMTLHDTGTSYILKTGALWSGPIGKSEIVFRFSRPMPLIALQYAPTSYAYYEDNALHWVFHDFVPTEDIEVHWSTDLREKYAGRFSERFFGRARDYLWDHEALEIVDAEYETYMIDRWKDAPDAQDRRAIAKMRLAATNARHEILARNGYVFRDRALAEYFGHQPWYAPDPGFTEAALTGIERLNVEYCRAIETLDDRVPTVRALDLKLQDIERRFW